MKKVVFALVILFLLLSCKKEKQDLETVQQLKTTLSINPDVKKDTAFKFLNTFPETYAYSDHIIIGARKSSNVDFYYDKKMISIRDSYNGVYNNVLADLKNNDSLYIRIGTSDGYTGYHLFLKIRGNYYSSEYYAFTDVGFYDDIEPKNIVLSQSLVLDKSKYKLNDSIYGFINFKSQYIDKRNDTIIVTAKGHFRAKVRESEF